MRQSDGVMVHDGTHKPLEALKSTRPATVLVVEDEILTRMMLAENLACEGYKVIQAADFDEALSVLQGSEPVDAIVTDIRMPGEMDGIGLAKLVRETWPEIKVVVASSHIPSRPSRNIAHAFFRKPFPPKRLAKRLRLLLNGSKI